jgi:hypothetical protein
MNRSVALAAFLASLAGFSGPVSAAIFCVTNSVELQEALDLAEVNGEDDTVRIAAGTYPAPNAPFGFWYDPDAHADGDFRAIELSGGWDAMTGCSEQHVDPSLTVIDGGDASRAMNIWVRTSGDVTVRYLTFANGNLPASQRGAGLYVPNRPGYAGTIRIENNVLRDNTAGYAGAISISMNAAAQARLFVVNNLLVFNRSTSQNGTAEFSLGSGQVFLTNNTASLNVSNGPTPRAIDIFGDADFLIANNNLVGNGGGSDLHLRTTTVTLLHNNIGVRTGDVPDNEAGNISIVPDYQDGNLPFTPVRNSPLVDAGIAPDASWYLTEFDLNATPRVVGPAVDIGACENERIFAGDFQFLP